MNRKNEEMDFAGELQKLLNEEELPLGEPLTELVRANADCLEALQKNETNLALQIEEIYDIIKDSDTNAKELKAAVKRENILLAGLVATSDLIDGLLYHESNKEHTSVITTKLAEIINYCGLEPLGFSGEKLDPQIHTVSSAEFNGAPAESVIRVLERGYAYRGKILRKATVILSKGAENTWS